MFQVKTFGTEIKPLQTKREMQEIDTLVNEFISANNVKKVISVSDSLTTADNGETIGLIRVVCYET